MKKYLKFIVAGICFMLAACGGGNNSKSTPDSTSTPSVNTSTNKPSSSISVENIGETMSKIDEIIKGYVPDVVDSDITLPTSIEEYNITISWHSQSPNVISETGKYTKPVNDTTVILTATYEYKGTGVHKVEIQPIVYGYTEQEKVDLAKGEVSKPEIDYNNTQITLVTTDSKFDVSIEWTISENDYAVIEDNTLKVSEEAFLEGTTFTLTATITKGSTTTETTFEYVINADDSLRAKKVANDVVKPELVDNKTLSVPVTGAYDATIEWTANDEEVVIEDTTITVPAKHEQWTLVITGTIKVGDATETISFDYQVAADDGAVAAHVANLIEELPTFGNATLEDKTSIDAVKAQLDGLSDVQKTKFNELDNAEELKNKIEELLSKYIEIRNVKLDSEKATWDAIDVATGYEITFTDLDKVFTVTTNEFVYADYGMPADTKYNVTINVLTGETVGYIAMGESVTQFGTVSELPKVADPYITQNADSFSWDATAYEGATTVRVYVNGVLRRELPISTGTYNYRLNGIAESLTAEEMNFVVQFVGNGTTHQSSNFVKFTTSVVGAGQVLPSSSLYVYNGKLNWTTGTWNNGYEVRIDDFRSFYTPYNNGLGTGNAYSVNIEDLNLPAGTYTAKIRAMADNGGTPSAWSNEVSIVVVEDVVDGPSNIVYDNNSLFLSWDEVENALYYVVSIPSVGYETIVTTSSTDLGLAKLENGDYEVTVKAVTYTNGETTGSITINRSKLSTLSFTVNISETKLTAPTNVVADYSGVKWDTVENAIGYEVVINGISYTTTTNSFVFAENELTMLFDYVVKVKALGASIADNSFYTTEQTIKYELTNIALASLGATVEATSGTGASIIDGDNGSRWIATSDDIDDGTSPTVTVTLDKEYTIYGFHVYWEGANAAEYDVEVSTDGLTWETVYEYRTTPVLEARHDYLNLNTAINAKYVRITCLVKGSAYPYSMYTLEVFTIN